MSTSPYVFEATLENFEQGVIENSHKVPVLVDFWAEWCEPCKQLMPILDKLVNEFDGGLVLAKVNSDQQQELSSRYQVRGIPNVKLFRNGEMVDEFTGVQSEDSIRSMLEKHMPNAADELREQALELIKQGDMAGGRKTLLEAEQMAPRHVMIQIDLAHLDAEQEEYQTATDRLLKLGIEAREKPEVASLLAKMEFASAAQQGGEIADLQQQIDADGNNSTARFQLASQCVMQGYYEDALEQLLQLLMKDRKYNDDAGRRGMLSIFKVLGDDHPLTAAYRRKMFNAMH